MIKGFLIKIITSFFFIMDKLVGMFRRDHLRVLMKATCKAFETISKNELNFAFNVIPRDSTEVPFIRGLNAEPAFAIVLQGPICKADNMTCGTIAYYKEMYPNAQLILSTWEDEDPEICRAMEEMGAILVKNKKPTKTGVLNVNMQLVSSLNGMKKAEELGIQYVVKTRTDQRISKPYFFDFLFSLLRTFPLSVNCGQKERVIAISMPRGSMFSPYYLSDYLYFGTTADLKLLFSAPLDVRDYVRQKNRDSRRVNAEKMYPPEIYILKHFFERITGHSCGDSVKEYWRLVRDHLITLDEKHLNLIWNKYDDRYELNRSWGEYFGVDDSSKIMETMNFDFINWLNLYSGVTSYKSEYEQYANAPLGLSQQK